MVDGRPVVVLRLPNDGSPSSTVSRNDVVAGRAVAGRPVAAQVVWRVCRVWHGGGAYAGRLHARFRHPVGVRPLRRCPAPTQPRARAHHVRALRFILLVSLAARRGDCTDPTRQCQWQLLNQLAANECCCCYCKHHPLHRHHVVNYPPPLQSQSRRGEEVSQVCRPQSASREAAVKSGGQMAGRSREQKYHESRRLINHLSARPQQQLHVLCRPVLRATCARCLAAPRPKAGYAAGVT